MAQLDLSKGSIEEQIVVYAAMNLSPEDISERIGGVLTPARVRLKVKELLKAGDWLTEAEREKALLSIALRQIGELQQVAGTGDLEASKVLLQYIKDVMDRLEKRQSKVNMSLDTYHQNVGAVIGGLFEIMLTHMRGALNNDVDPGRWAELGQEGMTIAWAEIEAHQTPEGRSVA